MATCCGWDDAKVPVTQTEALRQPTLPEGLLEQVEVDGGRWMTLLRCTVCHRYWCEDSMDSGQMTAFFRYPIRDPDAVAWFATAKPLNPTASSEGWGFPT